MEFSSNSDDDFARALSRYIQSLVRNGQVMQSSQHDFSDVPVTSSTKLMLVGGSKRIFNPDLQNIVSDVRRKVSVCTGSRYAKLM